MELLGKDFLEISLSIALCLALTLIAYWKGILDIKGSLSAYFIGIIIALFQSIFWLAMLLAFLVTSFIATRYEFDYKMKRDVQEGVKGRRGIGSVFANGIIPTFIAFISFFDTPYFQKEISGVVFLSAIAVATADTFASEIGVLSENAYLIINLKKRVKPGTNGGVSVLGTVSAFLGSLFVASVGWAFLYSTGTLPHNVLFAMLPLGIGFLGCQIDSILGATLEDRGYLTKNTVNLVSIALGSALAWVILWVVI